MTDDNIYLRPDNGKRSCLACHRNRARQWNADHRLGHNTTQMARHYGKASEQQDREAVERLAEVIG